MERESLSHGIPGGALNLLALATKQIFSPVHPHLFYYLFSHHHLLLLLLFAAPSSCLKDCEREREREREGEMGRLGICVLLAVLGAAFMMLFSSTKIGGGHGGGGGDGNAVKLHSDLDSANRGAFMLTRVEDIGPMITNRKLKERSQRMRAERGAAHDLGRIETEDYPQFDPSPNSNAIVKAGPIEHGTPLMPYIPRPTPPLHPITPLPSNPKPGSP